MYVGTHYNSYYNTLFGNAGSVYGGSGAGKISNPYLNSLVNSGSGSLFGGKGLFNYNSVSSTGLQYVFDLKEGASGLSSSISSLSSGAAFRKTAAVSSDKEAMTVTGGESKYSFSSISPSSVEIKQIAEGQKNTGNSLAAGDKTSLSGKQQFSIETDGRSYTLSVDIKESDTNKDVQQKMADAINKANIGVTASVETNDKDKTSALSISAKSTGDNAKSKFSIKDVVGSAVAETGADKTTQAAQNAVYKVNGGAEQVSQSNTVSLSGGVTATLKKAGGDPVTISRGTDSAYAEKQVNEFVNNYNKLYGATLNNSNDPKAQRLFTSLVNTSKTYASKLADAGIEFDSNGYMKINEEQFKKAAENGNLEKFFTENNNKNYGFTNQISRISRQVQTNTAAYVSRNTLTDYTANAASELLSSFAGLNYMNNGFTANMRDFSRGTGLFETSGMLFDFLL
ncbi:MAG: hypothetical protein FWG32_01670 [Oscillospiraceae bacterium]|nr:hypothetical protein [Oscillospiraceae bacterium]